MICLARIVLYRRLTELQHQNRVGGTDPNDTRGRVPQDFEADISFHVSFGHESDDEEAQIACSDVEDADDTYQTYVEPKNSKRKSTDSLMDCAAQNRQEPAEEAAGAATSSEKDDASKASGGGTSDAS